PNFRPEPAEVTNVSEVDVPRVAQLAPVGSSPTESAPSQPTGSLHTPFDEPTRAAVGQIAETSAKKVVEQWTNPALGGSGFSSPGKGKSAAGAIAAAATAARASQTFDADARRQQLINDRLSEINEQHDERGEPDDHDLSDADY